MPRQTDDVFEEEFFASLYDHFNTWDVCDDFYLGLARGTRGHVLDLGCGTGMLACRIAQEGVSATGADPAEGMLRVARSRQGSERVSWIKADGQTLRLPLRFDLVYMTGHAFQALLTDDDAVAVLRTITRTLGATRTPAEIAAWPRTVIRSRGPRALTRSTENPFSSLLDRAMRDAFRKMHH